MLISSISNVVGFTPDGVKIVATTIVPDGGTNTTVAAQVNKIRMFKDWVSGGTGYFTSCASGGISFVTGASTMSSPNVVSVTNAQAMISGVVLIKILSFGA